MVFSPLVLFILLLLAVVLVVWFYGYFGKKPETFVSFEHSMKAGATIPSSNELPPYSGNHPNQNIAKVYDNVFYDINNGNLIEVDSPEIEKNPNVVVPTVGTTAKPVVGAVTAKPVVGAVTSKPKRNINKDEEEEEPIEEEEEPIEEEEIESFKVQGQEKVQGKAKVQGKGQIYKNKIDDSLADTIENIWISCRKDAGNPVVHYLGNTSAVTPESQLDLVNSYNHFVYNTQSKNTDPYAVLYVSWLDGTFITMINLKTNELVTTELYSSKGTTSNTLLYNQSSLSPLTTKTQITIDNNPDNNTYVLLKKYDPKNHVFQLSSNIYFDTRNAQLIATVPTTDNITVFSRIGKIIPNGYLNNTTYEASPVFNSWDYYDSAGTKMVIYISYIEVTLIILLEADQNGSYRIFNVQRFDTNGVDTGNNEAITKPTATTSAPTTAPPTTSNVTVSNNPPNINFPGTGMNPNQNMIHDYYQWFYNWTKNGKNDKLKHDYMYSEDYMLKTQIVPPVCPACSTSLGTCVNCSSGNTLSGNDSIFYNPWLNIYSKDKNIQMGNTFANNNGVEDDWESCSEDSYDGNTYANTYTTNATYAMNNYVKKDNPIYNTVNNSVQGNNDQRNNDQGEGEAEADHEHGEGEDEGEGEGEGEEEEQEEGDRNNNSRNIMDPYSYFNSVPSKGSNFVPILSDFSKFGR